MARRREEKRRDETRVDRDRETEREEEKAIKKKRVFLLRVVWRIFRAAAILLGIMQPCVVSV